MSYYVYILISRRNGSFYTGHTSDLKRRLSEHNRGRVRSTKYYRPWKVHYFEKLNSKSEAYQRELFFKSINGYVYLKNNGIK